MHQRKSITKRLMIETRKNRGFRSSTPHPRLHYYTGNRCAHVELMSLGGCTSLGKLLTHNAKEKSNEYRPRNVQRRKSVKTTQTHLTPTHRVSKDRHGQHRAYRTMQLTTSTPCYSMSCIFCRMWNASRRTLLHIESFCTSRHMGKQAGGNISHALYSSVYCSTCTDCHEWPSASLQEMLFVLQTMYDVSYLAWHRLRAVKIFLKIYAS